MNSVNHTGSRSHGLRGNAVKARCAANHDQRLALRDAARPALHSHAARGNEDELAAKPVQDRHLGADIDLDVGRNKTARRQPGWAFPAIGAPETPVLRLTRGQAYLCPVGYSGLRRDMYNDECAAWERDKN